MTKLDIEYLSVSTLLPYTVGYAKPPPDTRFQPGQSENPKGRPKGKKKPPQFLQHERLKEIILAEAYRPIKVNDGDKHFNIMAPDPIPHPDDINVNFDNGVVSIHGPQTKEGLADLDLWLNRKNDNEAELGASMENLKDPEYAPCLKFLDDEIAHTKHILIIIGKALALRASPQCIQRRLSQLNLTTPDYLVKLRALKETQASDESEYPRLPN